jgi:LmbE family N-acetylglucosaminyl deacetylase
LGRVTAALAIGPGQRWLVLAPHPDDEVLATGGLLQRLAAARVPVGVLLLTNGGNNPWPQRWLERRWSLDAEASARWGARRQAETERALAHLGLDPREVLTAIGWPDGGLTQLLDTDPEGCVARLANEFERTRPTHVAVPGAGDRHPDHNAAAVMAVLAAERLAQAPRLLSYQIHGPAIAQAQILLALEPEQVRRKRQALGEHQTQITLSRRRFEAFVTGSERFQDDLFALGAADAPRLSVREGAAEVELRIAPLHPPLWRLRRPLLHMVWQDWNGVLHARALELTRRDRNWLRWDPSQRALTVTVSALGGMRQLFVKIGSGLRGVWIYDQAGYLRFQSAASGPSEKATPAPY